MEEVLQFLFGLEELQHVALPVMSVGGGAMRSVLGHMSSGSTGTALGFCDALLSNGAVRTASTTDRETDDSEETL